MPEPSCPRAVALCLAAAAALCPAAQAGLPPVVDRLPESAAVYAVTPDLSALLADVTRAGQQYGELLTAEARAALGGVALAQGLVSQPGIDGAGSAALVLLPGEGPAGWDGAPGLGVVGLLPITDFAAFLEGPLVRAFAPQTEAGLTRMTTPMGDVFFRDLGGFALVGPDGDLVRGFDAAPGRLERHAELAGAAGGALAASGDVVLVADVSVMEGPLRAQLAELDAIANFAANLGDAGAQAITVSRLVRTAAEGFLADGRRGMAGLDLSEAGVSLDLAASFEPGSEVAGFFGGGGASGGLLAALPEGEFVGAFALDLGPAGARRLAENAFALAGADAGALPEAASGYAGVVQATPALGAGLMAGLVQYVPSAEPAAVVDAFRDRLAGFDGREGGGLIARTEFAPAAERVGGRDVATYAVTSEPAGDGVNGALPVDPAQVQLLLFGPDAGPSGFVAAAERGAYVTASRNSRLLEAALDAETGEAGLDRAPLVAAVAGELPAGRVAEGYLSVDGLMRSLGPVAAVFGAPAPRVGDERLPPVGFAAAPVDAGVRFRVHVPAGVIGFVAEMTPETALPGPDGGRDPEPSF